MLFILFLGRKMGKPFYGGEKRCCACGAAGKVCTAFPGCEDRFYSKPQKSRQQGKRTEAAQSQDDTAYRTGGR